VNTSNLKGWSQYGRMYTSFWHWNAVTVPVTGYVNNALHCSTTMQQPVTSFCVSLRRIKSETQKSEKRRHYRNWNLPKIPVPGCILSTVFKKCATFILTPNCRVLDSVWNLKHNSCNNSHLNVHMLQHLPWKKSWLSGDIDKTDWSLDDPISMHLAHWFITCILIKLVFGSC